MALALAIIGCVACHMWSVSYSRRMEDKYVLGCINWWLSALIAAPLVAALLTIEEEPFWVFAVLAVACAALGAWWARRTMLGRGATRTEALLAALAQVASAVGIAVAVIFVLFLFFGVSGNRRRRR